MTRILVILGVPAVLAALGAAAASVGLIGRPAVAELKRPVLAEQLGNARIIVREFHRRGHPPAVILAALTNAWQESRWKADAVGDNGASVGLFQLNAHGAGKGMSVEARKDPVTNTRKILDVLETDGREVLAAEKRGASIAELAALFSEHVERPKDREGEKKLRAQLARDLWGDAADRAGPLVSLPAVLQEAAA